MLRTIWVWQTSLVAKISCGEWIKRTRALHQWAGVAHCAPGNRRMPQAIQPTNPYEHSGKSASITASNIRATALCSRRFSTVGTVSANC